MNPQYIILGAELAVKAVNALRIIHQSPHPKNIHDEISNIINAIETTATAYNPPAEIPEPAETKSEAS